jgi:hypothetical protein
MSISKVEHNLHVYRQEQVRLQNKREEDYRKLVERRNFDRIVAERVARNIRLDLDKGRYVDMEI